MMFSTQSNAFKSEICYNKILCDYDDGTFPPQVIYVKRWSDHNSEWRHLECL